MLLGRMLESIKNLINNGKPILQLGRMPKYTEDLQINGKLLSQPGTKNQKNNIKQLVQPEIN